MSNDPSGNAIGIVRVLLFLFLFLPATTSAHNVDGNSQEVLAEAIHTLQVAAGLTPDTSGPTGITFSNENETGLTGESHGPDGCVGPATWDPL